VSTILAIDTASPSFALALGEEGAIVRSLERDSNQDHSRLLLAAIDEITEGRRAALDGVVVVRGPGSYAGLRVGIATAEGLALARSIPIAGVGTLEAVARACGHDACVAIHPAGRGEFAAQHFEGGAAAGPTAAVRAEELSGTICGEGAGALGGTEIGPEQRCRAALGLGAPLLDGARGRGVEAIYLREPHISRPGSGKKRAPGA